MTAIRLQAGAVLAGLLLAAGCGSSSGSLASGTPPAPVTVSSSAASSSVAPPAAMSPSVAPSAASAGSPSASLAPSPTAAPVPSSAVTEAGSAGGSDAAACKTIAETLQVLTSAASEGRDNPGLKEMQALIKSLRATAPSAIRDDLLVIADFDQKVVDDVLAGKQPDIAETPPLAAAMQHEASWAATHCAHG